MLARQGSRSATITRRSLSPTLYARLRRLAGPLAGGERATRAIDPTELVHEAWIRLESSERRRYENVDHFHALAARTMRRVLIDRAKSRARVKRGGGAKVQTLVDLPAPAGTEEVVDAIVLEDALVRLEKLDAREARIVELRFFAGLDEKSIARTLGVSKRTVQNEWAHARAWLRRELSRGELA